MNSWLVYFWLIVELWPAWMELSHALHGFRSYLAFFFEFEEDSVQLVVNSCGRVFVKYSEAARGF